MKKLTLAIMALCLSALPIWAQDDAQLIEAAMKTDMASWSFPSSTVEINGLRYHLSDDGLAEFVYFFNNDVAPETLTIPAIVETDGKKYVVVSWYGSYYYNQNKTTKIVLPESMRYIKEYAFYGYPNVKEVTLPASVEKIDRYAFSDWSNHTIRFKSATPPTVTGELTSNGSNNQRLKVYVPAASFKEYVIADYIKSQCVISDDWKTIGDVTVSGVDNGELGYIVVADALPEIRTYAQINSLTIASGTINEDDWYQIRQMPNLVRLDISGLDIAEIPNDALYNRWQIETVILPPSLTTIGSRAFYSTGVKDLILPDALTTFNGSENFRNCDSLTSISIPDGVTSLPSSCLRACDNLHHVKLPANLASMGSDCFYYSDLYDVDIPGTLQTIPYEAFESNVNLKTVTLHEGLVNIGQEAFYGCASIEKITLPSTVRSISSYGFQSCSKLADVELNEGLETIEYYAFSNTALTDVTLPSTLIKATGYPFSSCPGITRITANSLIPPTVENQVITSNAGNIELLVPLWSFQEYMTTPGWLEFQNHLGIITDNLPENVYITKEFEFVLRPEDNVADYHPNVRLLYNDESIDDGFGHTKYQRGNLTISSRSKLAINDFSMHMSPFAKYYADESRFYNNYNYDYDNWRTIYNPNSLIVNGELRAEDQTINLMLRNDLWQFVSFPFDVEMKDIIPVDPLTQWVIREYSGAERAAQNFDNTWQNIPTNGTLQAGRGYIMKCYNKDVNSNTPVFFTVTALKNSLNRQKLFTNEDVKTPLDEFESEFEQNRSWNLIGNPYPSYFDTRYLETEAPFLIWNSYNQNYVAFSPVDDNYILNPGEAFFVQRPVQGGENLTFGKGGRQTYRNPRDLKVNEVKREGRAIRTDRFVYNITLSDGELTDRTRVVFNPEAKAAYESGRDAAKMFAMNETLPQLWTESAGVQYAINERPQDNGNVQLAVRIAKAGLHTIALTAGSAAGTIILTDTKTGITTDLSQGEYTFSAEEGTAKNRFYISINPTDATAINSVDGLTPAISEGEGATYNVAGQRVADSYRGIVIKNGKKVLNK